MSEVSATDGTKEDQRSHEVVDESDKASVRSQC